jgi:hypothetical protein
VPEVPKVPEVLEVLKVPEVPKAADFLPMVPLPMAHMLAHPTTVVQHTIVISLEMPCLFIHRVGKQGACPFLVPSQVQEVSQEVS